MTNTDEPRMPESPNTRMRRQAAQRAQVRESASPDPTETSSGRTTTPPIDPVLLGPLGQPGPPRNAGSRRRPRSPSPEPYRDLTPQANQILSNPNKRLKAGSASDFLEFARARPDVRQLMLFHALLQGQDQQQDSTTVNWTMPPELKDNIGMFTYAVLMSARLTTYRNKLTPTILDLLKRHGLLPKGLAMGNLNKIRRAISASATNFRSSIKKKIIQSINGQWHVTKLATQLLAKAPDLKITSALLTRLAFIRFQYANATTDQVKGDGFWPHVSDKLDETNASASNAIELSHVLKVYLSNDEALYTTGPKKKPAIAAITELGDLQTLVDERAALIEIGATDRDSEDGEDDGEEGGND